MSAFITKDELARHQTADSLWLQIDNLVYDTLEFKKCVSETYCPCVVHNYKTDSAVAAYRILKVGSQDFTVGEIQTGDAEETGVLGISVTAASGAGEVIKVCTGGVFSVQIESGSGVSRGDRLFRSTNESGTAETTSSSVGTFGIALEDAPSSTPGPVVKAVFIKSENY